ncbi:UDP-N-acetylglucosamine 2-epimerase [Magnetospira thiophila]
MNSRCIGIATSSRADFGLLRGLMGAVKTHPALSLIVYATGMHHSSAHGATLSEIRDAGFEDVLVEVPTWSPGDNDQSVAHQMARGVAGFADAFAARRPDILVVLGDRFDVFPAALAALPFTLPVAHISGGDVTEGAIDDAIRHSLTKLSHLHFATNALSAQRIRQLGEEPQRIFVSGQPGLDAVRHFVPLSREALASRLELDPNRPITLCTFHPETLAPDQSVGTITALLSAAAQVDSQIIFTSPNSDPGSEAIRTAILADCAARPDHVFRTSLGRELYWHALANVDCMIGNSSSGLTEAVSFHLPVVDIAGRQQGRFAPENVISCTGETASIVAAWRRALTSEFRGSLADVVNPYGDGHAVERILDVLISVPLDHRLVAKRFADLPAPETVGHER